MCGIIGITSTTPSSLGLRVLEGLKSMEYRGYDSWGIAESNNDKPTVTKQLGGPSESQFQSTNSIKAIGHTRWATHGARATNNAHPHRQGRVTLVHNGTINNYLATKEGLLQHGYTFVSETDSEVAAALFDNCIATYPNDIPMALSVACAQLKTEDSAYLLMIKNIPGLYAMRSGTSALVVGVGKEVSYIASDILAFAPHTTTVNYLNKQEGCYCHGSERQFFSLKNQSPIEKDDIVVNVENKNYAKGDYLHYMRMEIEAQRDSIAKALNQPPEDIASATNLILNKQRIYITGCGTSEKVAMAARHWFATIAGVECHVHAASEMSAYMPFVNLNTLVIAISQSGETADVMGIIEEAKSAGATIMALTNVATSNLARESELALLLNTGPEKAVASTKATTAQMAILYQLAISVADKKGLNHVQAKTDLVNLAGNLAEQLNPKYTQHAERIGRQLGQHKKQLMIIGTGALHAIALESAIKIQEVAYISAHGFASRELKHGPLALIEQGIPCLVLGDSEATLGAAELVKTKGGTIYGIATKKHAVFDHWLKIADCGEAEAIAALIPVQYIAYFAALERGSNPDMPRNLAKSVTVK